MLLLSDPELLLILLGIASVPCLIGFYKFLYFISIGYGASIAALGIGLIILFHDTLTITSLPMCLLLFAYGFRLSSYLYKREKIASYKEYADKEIGAIEAGFFKKVAVWLLVSVLYVTMVSPVFFMMNNIGDDTVITFIGFFVALGGFFLEFFADRQKQAAKEKEPKKFVQTKLYKICRCPNYLGEVIFWTGVFIFGLGDLYEAYEYITAIFGYLSIVWIMFGGARRLEMRQNKTYQDDAEYKKYSQNTPIIIPLIPLYSLERYKWLVG